MYIHTLYLPLRGALSKRYRQAVKTSENCRLEIFILDLGLQATTEERNKVDFSLMFFHNIKWVPTKGNGKWYLPCTSISPSTTSPSLTISRPHKVKSYADDLTIISSTPRDHQDIVTLVDARCKDVSLFVRQDKCFSFIFDGKVPKNTQQNIRGVFWNLPIK